MQTKTIRILLPLLIVVVLLSYGLNDQKKVFKFFQCESSPAIKNIIYSDKKALNNLIIEMQDGDINILCIPFTKNEYERALKRMENDQATLPRESIELQISGRKLKASKKLVGQNECSILCADYYEGIAISVLYNGNCNILTGLKPILASIKYHFSKETREKARNDFLDIMKSIEKMNIPTYDKAYDIQRRYSLIGLNRRITYRVEIERYSLEILNFYRQFFAAHGWKPYKSEGQENWSENRLFFTWIDRTDEIFAKLLILSGPKAKNAKLAPQEVLIDVTPYSVLEWGTREVKPY